MQTVIGLYWHDEDVQQLTYALQKAGIQNYSMTILAHKTNAQKFLASAQNHLIEKYAGWGAFLCLAVFDMYGLSAAYGWTDHISCQRPSFWVGDLIFLAALGLIFGGLVGWLLACKRSSRGQRMYIQKVRQGGKLVAIRSDNRQAEKVAEILHQGNGVAIKMLAQGLSI